MRRASAPPGPEAERRGSGHRSGAATQRGAQFPLGVRSARSSGGAGVPKVSPASPASGGCDLLEAALARAEAEVWRQQRNAQHARAAKEASMKGNAKAKASAPRKAPTPCQRQGLGRPSTARTKAAVTSRTPAEVLCGVANFLDFQGLVHGRRVSQVWRDAVDASVDERAQTATFFSQARPADQQWDELRWMAAARHVPDELCRFCEPAWQDPRPGPLARRCAIVALASRFAAALAAAPVEVPLLAVGGDAREAAQAGERSRATIATCMRQLLGGIVASGICHIVVSQLLPAMPVCPRAVGQRSNLFIGEVRDFAFERLAVLSPAADDYLVALAFLQDRPSASSGSSAAPSANKPFAARALLETVWQPDGGAGGSMRLLSQLCASPKLAAVRRTLLRRIREVPTEEAEQAALLRELKSRQRVGQTDEAAAARALRLAIVAKGFEEVAYMDSHGMHHNLEHCSDCRELVRLAVRVRRARAIFDRLDADGDRRLRSEELLRFVDMAVPGLLDQQAARLRVPPAARRQQYVLSMGSLRAPRGFIADMVQGAYAEDRISVYAMLHRPPHAAAAMEVLHVALSAMLTTPIPGELSGIPKPLSGDDELAVLAELAHGVDLTRSLVIRSQEQEVLGPPVAVMMRFHTKALCESDVGRKALFALASSAALTKCASTEYHSERWCKCVPQLLELFCQPEMLLQRRRGELPRVTVFTQPDPSVVLETVRFCMGHADRA